MSYIEYSRRGDDVFSREMWDTNDIAEYCNLSFEKADKLHMLANRACDVVGYGDISKEDFLGFLSQVEAAKESQRLQDEANAASVMYAQKSYRLNLTSLWISQAIALLSNL